MDEKRKSQTMSEKDDISESQSEAQDYLYSSLLRLRFLSIRLRHLGLGIVVNTFLLVLLTAVMGVTKSREVNYGYEDLLAIQSSNLFYVIITLTMLNFIFLVLYDLMIKQGNAIFEEISDELQWKINSVGEIIKTKPTKNAFVRPELESRIILRMYSRSTDLPIIPGKFGPAIYIILSILSVFLNSFLFVQGVSRSI